MIVQHDHTQVQAVSLVAITAGPVSFWTHLDPYLTGALTILGLVWYGIIFTEKLFHWYRRWKTKHK